MTTRAARHHASATAKPHRDLRELAKHAGLMPAYRSSLDNKQHHAPTQTLLAALNALGIDITNPDDAQRILKHRLLEQASSPLPPITVATANRKSHALLRLPTSRNGTPKATGTARLHITTEDGQTLEHTAPLKDLPTTSTKLPDATHAHFAKLPLPKLPMGYHTLTVTHREHTAVSRIISAPTVSWQVPDDPTDGKLKSLGLFCPTYALQSEHSIGIGNLSDLRELASWAHRHGCDLISTLPLLAVFNDDSQLHEPAPYSPVSRRFWNELYIDPANAPAFDACTQAKKILANPAFERERRKLLDRESTADHRAAARLNTQLLDALADHFFANNLQRSEPFQTFLREQPLADRYARFRAACEQTGKHWADWPARLRNGTIRPADIDRHAEQRHLYAQFAMASQMAAFSGDMAERGSRLYLDLAIGVHPHGFDVWNDPDAYMTDTSVGAPPDPMFTQGQDWGFPPLHPDHARNKAYREIIDAIRTHTDHAHFLRLDHVMGFHRLYLIPNGIPSSEGVYCRYNEDELFAILSLESHRAKCRLIGENLGTVPDIVEKKMSKHRIAKLYVGQFEARPDPEAPMNPVPREVAASLNTHDLPTFAQHHTARDVPERIDAGVYNPDLADDEIANRKKTAAALEQWLAEAGLVNAAKPKPAAVAEALYKYLAESDAELALVNIEDLWGETHWQNIPGTTTEHPNWQHKLAKSLEQIERSTKLKKLLKDFAARRRGETRAFPTTTAKRKR